MEPKKLTKRELAVFREVAAHHDGSAVQRLIDHIDAIEAEEDQRLNPILAALRAIDEQIPSDAKLPGSPNLTEQMAHLLVKYNKQTERIEALESALREMIEISIPDSSNGLKLGDLVIA